MDGGSVADAAGHVPELLVQHQVDNLAKLLKDKEAEFGLQRKKFIDIYKQKEAESQKFHSDATRLDEENARLKEELASLRRQVEDAQSQLAISAISKDEELEVLKSKHQEELSSLNSSLQAIMEDTARQASTSATAFYEQDRKKLLEHIDRLEAELASSRSVSTAGPVASAASSAVSPPKESEKLSRQRAMPAVQRTEGRAASADGSLERGMRQSARTAASYEAELEALRLQIDDAHKKLEQYANNEQGAVQAKPKPLDLFEVVNQEERIAELQQELKNEKHARRDLEMYVAVLNEQKAVFQNDIEKLRHELREALELLNRERRAADGIRLTWQMANDQFLESHRLLMRDMKRMESLLTEEQQRRLSELQKKDAEIDRQPKSSPAAAQASILPEELNRGTLVASRSSSAGSLHPEYQSSAAAGAGAAMANGRSAGASTPKAATGQDAPPGRSRSSTREIGLDCEVTGARVLNVSLTEEQQKSLSDPQPEDVENKKLLDSFRISAATDMTSAAPAAVPATGKRLVSEKEWEMLQIELQASRTKLGRPCDMCKNYELELQKEQERQKNLEMALTQSRQSVKAQAKTIESLEGYLKANSETTKDELQSLQKKLSTYEERLREMAEQMETDVEVFKHQLSEIATDRGVIYRELMEIQKENESILNAHSKSSQEMQAETISLPNSMEEMERLLLQYREQLISSKAAREHLEGRYASELMLVRSQLISERQAAKQLEEALALDISHMQSRLAHLTEMEARLNVESEIRHDLEQKLGVVQADCDVKNKFIQGLKASLIEQTELRKKLEEVTGDLKDKIRNLQRDLDSSEVVQRDFVKLSQELQVQLETIRHSENEVRWQHPEDIDGCHGCKRAFTGAKHKNHCKHCGKIFCVDCLSKVVNSGPSHRPSRVCDVCHTILVKNATPYFSSPR